MATRDAGEIDEGFFCHCASAGAGAVADGAVGEEGWTVDDFEEGIDESMEKNPKTCERIVVFFYLRFGE